MVKLVNMQNFSQVDPRWKNIKIGTSNQTIGQIGCTITCLAMLADKNPAQVNAELKSVNGYDNNSKVIWDKINQTNLNLVFVKRVYSYNNQDVINNLPCLVEVKLKLIRHWVLFTGNRRMIDTIDGKEKSTNIYPLIGYAIVKRKENPQPPEPPKPPPPPSGVAELQLQELYHLAFGPKRVLDASGRDYYVPQIQTGRSFEFMGAGRSLENILCELIRSEEHRNLFTLIETLQNEIAKKTTAIENKEEMEVVRDKEIFELKKMLNDYKDNPRRDLPLR